MHTGRAQCMHFARPDETCCRHASSVSAVWEVTLSAMVWRYGLNDAFARRNPSCELRNSLRQRGQHFGGAGEVVVVELGQLNVDALQEPAPLAGRLRHRAGGK